MAIRSSFLFVSAVAVLTGSVLHANVIFPGDTGITPDSFSLSDISLVTDSGVLEYSFDGGLTSGLYESAVLTDPFNTFCPGCLDFAFVFDVTDSNNSITELDMSSFGNLSLDGGYSISTGGEIIPSSMSRSADGGTIGFNTQVQAGEASVFLIVMTPVTSYDTNGTATFVDNNGISFGVPDYEPVTTPEPSSAVPLGLGMLALASLPKKLRRFTGGR